MLLYFFRSLQGTVRKLFLTLRLEIIENQSKIFLEIQIKVFSPFSSTFPYNLCFLISYFQHLHLSTRNLGPFPSPSRERGSSQLFFYKRTFQTVEHFQTYANKTRAYFCCVEKMNLC